MLRFCDRRAVVHHHHRRPRHRAPPPVGRPPEEMDGKISLCSVCVLPRATLRAEASSVCSVLRVGAHVERTTMVHACINTHTIFRCSISTCILPVKTNRQ